MFEPRQPFSILKPLVIAAMLSLMWASRVFAHEGPPFPLLMDQEAAGYVVSIWADPDIGDARFFIIIESPSGGQSPEEPQVSMWVEPVDGRLDRVTYEANRQTLRNQMQLQAEPFFDQRDMWNVGFRITSPIGETHELTTQVESTPPGYGPWDLVIYLFPFALLGGMWIVALVRRRRTQRIATNGLSPQSRP